MIKFSGRRASRVLIIQSLYSWLLCGQLQSELLKDLQKNDYIKMFESFEPNADIQIERGDHLYAEQLLKGVINDTDRLNALIAPKCDRPIDQLGPIEHAILLLGTYELKYKKDVPERVVINEAIELAKHFGAQDSHKYINGVLDRLRKELRPSEAAVA